MELVQKVQDAIDNDYLLVKITKVVLIGSFVFDWVLLILMLKSISAFDADCLRLLLAQPFSH